MINKQPRVFIITINYNGYKDTVACIESLRKIKYLNYEIVVVENASDDSQKIAEDPYINENATVILSNRNSGFSDGNNQGIRYAMEQGADFVLLINNDTVVDENFLDALVNTAQRHEDAGIVTGNIYYFKEPKKLWYSNGNFDTRTCITRMVCESSRQEENVTFVCGCLMLIRTKAIRSIGLLEDMFFLYSEDTEYGCRMIKNGYKMYWTPDAHIYHKISASTKECSDFQQYYLIRNNFLMIRLYSTNKFLSYINHAYICLKKILRGRASLRCVKDAVADNLKRQYGRSIKY